MEVAVAGVEDVADPQPVLASELADPAQHLRQPRPRHDPVLDVVVGRHAAHRGERRLAPAPEQRPLRLVGRDADLERAAREAELAHRGHVLLDLDGDAVELDEQHGARAGRVARRDCRLGGLDRERVHHLDRRRQDPGRDRPGHGRGGLVRRSGTRRGASARPRACRSTRSVTFVAMPSVPSEPTTTPSRSGASPSASSTTSPSGSTSSRPTHVVDREPVLQAVRAAGVLGDVAADRAHLLARRVGRVEEALRLDGARHVQVRDARLHDDPLRVEVDLEHAVHPRQRDDDAAHDRRRAAGEPRPRAAGDPRDLALGRRAAARACTSSVEPGRTTSAGCAR